MKILYINNDGAGFADYIEVDAAMTVSQFFQSRNKGNPADFLIRVNRQPVASDYVLKDGDRVSITPTKIEGANTFFVQTEGQNHADLSITTT
ncbi:MAG: molybdopterin converting factor [Pirellulaceae bacterium]